MSGRAQFRKKREGEHSADASFSSFLSGELYNYVTSQSFNASTYPVSRFVNEFGMHSMSSLYTMERVLTSSSSYSFNSTELTQHNKHNPAASLEYPSNASAEGQAQMTTGVTDYFPTPDVPGDRRKTLEQWAYTTQIFQAAYMLSEILYYRLGAARPERNMGALYWMLK